jgi:hypothetical protein
MLSEVKSPQAGEGKAEIPLDEFQPGNSPHVPFGDGRMNVLELRTTWAAAMAAVAAAVLATLALGGGASANDCGSACRKAYNQCRIATKDSPSCEAQFTRCMQSCRGR